MTTSETNEELNPGSPTPVEAERPVSDAAKKGSALEVLLVSTKLGLTSFGGPIAHLGYFHNEYVERRKWLAPDVYAEVVALSQALPGPASSQVGIAIGLMRAGLIGGILAWLGFTLPSAAALVAFAFGVKEIGDVSDAAWLHGLKLAAVAIVAFAVWGMARSLAPDKERATIAIVAGILALTLETAIAQVGIIVLAGLIGWRLFFSAGSRPETHLPVAVGRNVAIGAWVLFFGLLFCLPLAAAAADSQALNIFDSFYRTGSLVFGGGHVVLPLIQREVVTPGWVTPDDFLAGYGAAQAVPGPLFTLAAYLGAIMGPQPNGVLGGTIALTAIFLPSFLLVVGGLPAWSLIRRNPSFLAALRGVNAAVVGLLLAALYNPVFTSGVRSAEDFSIAIAAFGLLAFWKTPPWMVVAFSALAAVAVDTL
ncbi:MAG TPA: chromate efflux transporter [Dehalococcoidia bacterium]|nr:chromate efflux transporter [Dehalococcoidia bacterium]